MEATYDGERLVVFTETDEPVDIALTPEEAKTITRAIAQWNLAQRKAWEKEQRAAGQVWVAKYWVHYAEIEQDFFSFEEAEEFLAYGRDYGELCPDNEAIRCPDGTIVTIGELREIE